jgi:hypothetical protein
MARLQPSHTTWQAVRWPILWVGLIGGLSVFDAWRASKEDGSTLSEVTRVLFAVDQPAGRAAFLASLKVGSAVLEAHILKKN